MCVELVRNLRHLRQLQSQTTAHSWSQTDRPCDPRHQQQSGFPALDKRRLAIWDSFGCPYNSEGYSASCVGRRFLTSGRTDGLFCLSLRYLHHGVQWPPWKLLIGGHFQMCQRNSRSLSVESLGREERQVQLKPVRMVSDTKLGRSGMFHS